MRSLRSAISASSAARAVRFVLERLDDLVEKFVDVGAVVALQRLLERVCWMSTSVILELALIASCVPIACREVEHPVGDHRFAQAGRVDDDPGRDDEVDRLGEFLNPAVDRVRDARREVDDALQQRAVGVLQVDDDDLAARSASAISVTSEKPRGEKTPPTDRRGDRLRVSGTTLRFGAGWSVS